MPRSLEMVVALLSVLKAGGVLLAVGISRFASLLDGLFRDGSDVLVSSLRTTFVPRLRKVQEALYRDAMANADCVDWYVELARRRAAAGA